MATDGIPEPRKEAPPGGFGRADSPEARLVSASDAPQPPTAIPPAKAPPSLSMRMAFTGAAFMMFAVRVPVILDAFRHCTTGEGSAVVSGAAVVIALAFGAGTLYTTLPGNFPSWDARRRAFVGSAVFWTGFIAVLIMVLTIFTDLPMRRCVPPGL